MKHDRGSQNDAKTVQPFILIGLVGNGASGEEIACGIEEESCPYAFYEAESRADIRFGAFGVAVLAAEAWGEIHASDINRGGLIYRIETPDKSAWRLLGKNAARYCKNKKLIFRRSIGRN
jgi:hypothetical protein